ncbi:acetyltransferase [Virgibacillus necropolis]|uniref:Acetyltransferase n=1 Tax=Virgibacillus necropolis TaxID=163877 RepID=A0A221MEC4_9BACI|nr:acetyltransferase [Virgibacillus necropolis]ASN05995.1 acetyltransferase [Virgibacillus necropolis]
MKIIIVGNGGHSRVIQEMISSTKANKIIAILDDKYEHGFQEKGIIHAPISFLVRLFRPDTKVVVAIGRNDVRKKIVKGLNLLPQHYLSIIHPSAIVSASAKIGYGTVIMPQAVINAEAEIGNHCIINTGAIIEHDNEIGDYTHVSPNATLTGNVSTGEGVHVGSSATIIPGIHLGRWSVIGAGSTVIEHIPAYSKAVGSPTRIIERILMK